MASCEFANADIKVGHRSTTFCHLANISLATGRKLNGDVATDTNPGDAQANAMLHDEYRSPWKLASGVHVRD